eukprot:CAMPEP_0184490862 /NCGR_PEP_ID=MMETSP0113_2-20130426/19111_1 /TAXON_ID=91329 /ORGANISM="Norrisiella sphaerica, Strain BC52" /LENGTH=425 /DNA_ID=CAMNT_0026874981 /DNA_START=98 /DNA_END=1375 /DNA_ORIENTATION=+
MALCFSINHGCVTAVLGLASANLGDELGGVQSGTLYILYTLSALLIATSLVHSLGAKWSLACGLGMYCFYVGSFLIAAKVEAVKWPAAIIGSAIGGTAAGWLWTAQGVYFARVAERYAVDSGIEKEKCTSWLASVFASIYVGFEVILKLASSFLYDFGSDVFVYTFFTVVAVACAVLMVFVPKEPPPMSQAENQPMSTGERLAQAGKLLATDARMRWIAGFEIMFGFSTSFLNFYINGTIVKAALGKKDIGYMSAVVPAVATLMAIPYSWLTNSIGKAPVMLGGCLSYLTIAIVVAAVQDGTLESLKWGLVFLYILAGNGRSVFEGTNKAMVADFFPEEKPAAFANIIITSGGASAIAFYVFPEMDKIAMAIVVAVACMYGIAGIIFAFRIHSARGKAEWGKVEEEDEEHVLEGKDAVNFTEPGG